jgi:hypothetical protein
LTVEVDEPQRILRDAKEDLHDTVFLELENGGTAEPDRGEIHRRHGLGCVPYRDTFFANVEWQSGNRPGTQRVIFHCRANAKKEMQNRENALSFRVEFSPRQIKARGQPDL